MKKLVLLGIISMVGLVACKKDKIQTSKQKGNLTAMSGVQPTEVLSIDSFTDYQSIIEQLEGTSIPNASQNFVSLKSVLNQLDSLKQVGEDAYYSSPYIGDTIYEDYGRLLDVLNQDKIVELNGQYVKVDLVSDSVYVINASVNDAYNIIKNNAPNDSMQAFSTAISVKIHIWVRIKFPPIGGCNESAAHSDKQGPLHIYCSNDNYRTKEKLVYQTAGIYFSILAKAKNQHEFAWTWWSWAGGQPGLYMTLTWKVKCGDTQPYWVGYAASWNGPGQPFNADSHKASFRPYSSTDPLTSYAVSCSFHSPCYIGTYLEIHS